MTNRELYDIRLRMHKASLSVKWFSNKVMKCAVHDTKYQNVAPLFTSHNLLVVCNEPKVAQLLQSTRRLAHLHLLGAVVDGQILSVAGLQRYASFAGLDAVRGQLCTILNTGAGKMAELLGRHQSELSRNLQQYVKQQTEDEREGFSDGKS